MQQPLPPFTSKYSPNLPEILNSLKCTIAISTYQAGKVVFLSAPTPEKIMQLPRNFEKAMGITLSGNKMAIAAKSNLHILKNKPEMAPNYPKNPNTYDALFMPKLTYHTGQLALHDLHWVGDKLYAINTLFSCISEFDDNFSFRSTWQPGFITELAPEDRCHLNGMAIANDRIEYVTALGETNNFHGWREKKLSGGVLIHVPTNKIVLRDLAMPHSPRVYDGKVYLLLSAEGKIVEVNPENGTYETILTTPYFIRGMAKYGDYLFVAHSKLRHNSSAFRDLPIAKESVKAGVMVIYLPYKSIIGSIMYENSIDEIYDVIVIPGFVRPNIMNLDSEENTYVVDSEYGDFWAILDEEKLKLIEKDRQ